MALVCVFAVFTVAVFGRRAMIEPGGGAIGEALELSMRFDKILFLQAWNRDGKAQDRRR